MIQPLLFKNYNPNLFLSPKINQVAQISMIDRPDIYLISSIILETLSTCFILDKVFFREVITLKKLLSTVVILFGVYLSS